MQLGSLEQRVMKHLWESYSKEAFTVRSVTETLNENGNSYAYNTILTVMTHLFEKGLLKRQKKGKTCVYRVGITECDFVEHASREAFERLHAQYGNLAVAHFANILESVDPKTLDAARNAIKKQS